MIVNTFVEILLRGWREEYSRGEISLYPKWVCGCTNAWERAHKFFMSLSSLTCMSLDWGMYGVRLCQICTHVCACSPWWCRYEPGRLQGFMEIRRYTAEKQVIKEREGGREGWKDGRKEGGRGERWKGLDNEDPDESEGEPWIETSQRWREVKKERERIRIECGEWLWMDQKMRNSCH